MIMETSESINWDEFLAKINNKDLVKTVRTLLKIDMREDLILWYMVGVSFIGIYREMGVIDDD